MATQELTDTHLQAVARINAAGFRARLIDGGGTLSIQVKVGTGDRRIAWHEHLCNCPPISPQWGDQVARVFAPGGFQYVHVTGTTILSYPVEREVDALVFAHLFEQAQPIRGPMSLSKLQLRALEESLTTIAA